MLVAARDAKVTSFTYAASSSTYGDHPALPKVEDVIGKPLSPYAVTKYVNELYANTFSRNYGFHCVGLRYFNVFGKRQNPNGAYAAVIPKWTGSLLNGETVYINGDGLTSRDFCYVENAIQANLLAAAACHENTESQVYNVAVGNQTTLLTLFNLLLKSIKSKGFETDSNLVHRELRSGDVRHSLANIGKISERLGYKPSHSITSGIPLAVDWYISNRQQLYL